MSSGFDAEILQDFLTESGELLDALEADLVLLESTPRDLDLINRVFRALHTIKGSASFLALTNLVRIAHAAETALNAARAGSVTVDRALMDRLLQAVDIVKRQLGQIAASEAVEEPPGALVDWLASVGSGGVSTPREAAGTSATPAPVAGVPAPPASGGCTCSPLTLSGAQEDLFEFLVSDVLESVRHMVEASARMQDASESAAASRELSDGASALRRALAFFECAPMARICDAVQRAADAFGTADEALRGQLRPRTCALVRILRAQAERLEKRELTDWSTAGLEEELATLGRGEALPGGAALHAEASADAVLAQHGIELSPGTAAVPPPTATTVAPTALADAEGEKPASAASAPAAVGDQDEKRASKVASVEQTIRVEVGRLETLMNLVGELVLQKNRVSAMTRQIASRLDHDTSETLVAVASSLDRVTGDIQVAVMRTRMQPLDKIFGKYPRLIRDLSRKTGKQIDLVIDGGETEVDKSVIDELADPLVHLLRNSADHGIELPQKREASGKPALGTIRLSATHEGSCVLVRVSDDGKGLHRQKLIDKAVQRGMVSAEQASTMTDKEVFALIFEPGFSTADAVSDLSGRGVGMDVVRSNVAKIKGSIELDSGAGVGTTVTIRIPLTIAIMPAMLVGVEREIYAIPLGNIVEIVRPMPQQRSTIREHPVMRLRDSILPLVSAAEVLGVRAASEDSPFAVVLAMGERRLGLLVSRLIGQQEIVIKSLDETAADKGAPVSGATVRDDGGVSLIVDVAGLFRIAQERQDGKRTGPPLAAMAA